MSKNKSLKAKPRHERSWPQNARSYSLNFIANMWQCETRQFIPNTDFMVWVRKYKRALTRMKRQSDRIKTLLKRIEELENGR